MGWWSERVVPRITDRALASEEVHALRAEACVGLHGRVVEIGFGSGLNLGHLPPEVTSISAVEPADVGWALSQVRRERASVPVVRTGLDGQALAEPAATFDAALVTFSLCTIPDPAAALAEVRRVLRPGGLLHFVEHGRSPDAGVHRWQRRLDPVQRRLCAGCHLSRDVPVLVSQAGLAVTDLRTAYLSGPRASRPWSHVYVGRARRTG